MTQAVPESLLVADAEFWPGVAAAVAQLADRAGSAPPADLRHLDVIVPSWNHAPLLRAALLGRLREQGHRGCIPPLLRTIAAWAGVPTEETIVRRVELFDALRASDWIRSAFGTRPGAIWTLAAHIEAISDELTLAAVDGPRALEDRLQASLARHFHRRAALALQPQAQLIVQLWRASVSKGDGSRALLDALRARTQEATRPLLFVAARPVAAWIRAWLSALAQRVPVRLVRADVGAAVAARPLLAAAWPELLGTNPESVPIASRARAVPAAQAGTGPVLVEAQSLEEEAIVVCEQVLAWLRPPGQGDLFEEPPLNSIALVAVDRLAARRVRAMLERAHVLVRDETGWKLSTTSAAAAVMGLFELSTNGFHHRDLLAWLKSPFALAGLAGKWFLIERIEKAVRSREIVQGLGAIVLALPEAGASDNQQGDPADARHWLRLIEKHVGRLAANEATLAARIHWLDEALGALGMRAGLAADPVGAEVLRVLDDLRASVASSRATGSVRLDSVEFRALIAARFEEEEGAAGAVDSPVTMVSLAGAALRDFEAAVLIGVDTAHLPALPPDRLFFSRAVRTDLGLPGIREATQEQAADLAALVVRVPRVVAVWCARDDDEPRTVATWVARLRAVARAAGYDPRRPARACVVRVEADPTVRPTPSAADRLRTKLSATQYQSLVDCPYQFFARHLLRLRAAEDVTDEPKPSEYGRAVHEILARFHEQWREFDLRLVPPAQLEASLTAHAEAVFDPKIDRRPRLLALRRQFAETQLAYLAWLRQRVEQGWSFVAAEVEETTSFDVGAGAVCTIELTGRIDRIDSRRQELEVLDYKARRRQQLADDLALPGESVQLPFYGLLHSGRVSRASYVFLQRTSDRQDQVGVLSPRQPYAQLVEALRVRLRTDLQRIAGGAALPALGNEAVCNWCEMRGLCRRDFWHDAGAAP